jgi:hypothetical protein
MEDKKLDVMNDLFDEITIEAKKAFVKRFPYLEIPYTKIDANQIVREVSETDGSILIGLSCALVIPFSTIKNVLTDIHMAYFNHELGYIYDNDKITLILKRFYYHTKKKFIFSI